MRKFLFIVDTYVAKDFASTCKHVVCMPLQHYYSTKLTPHPSSNITLNNYLKQGQLKYRLVLILYTGVHEKAYIYTPAA